MADAKDLEPIGNPRAERIAQLKSKARFRLMSAHFLPGDYHLLGDTETSDQGDEKGTIVGAGTKFEVNWPTLEMAPLNEEAEEWLKMEEDRIRKNDASMQPLDELPDLYETNYVPGFNRRRREPLPDGAALSEQL